MNPACETHRALVDRVLDGEPSDGDLVTYAEEVPDCAACRQALSVAARVHPQVLLQGGSVAGEVAFPEADPAMARLEQALEGGVPQARIRPIWVAVAVAAVGLLTVWWAQPAPVEAPLPGPSVVVEGVLPVADPGVVEPAPALISAERPTAMPDGDGIADAEPAEELPEWEPARGGTAKSVVGSLSVALVLGNPSPVAGEVVPLTVTASQATPVTLCVSGVEQGVVWRGDLTEGRTALTQGGQPLGFAFTAAGEYQFALATRDDPSCSDPVHRVQVRVAE